MEPFKKVSKSIGSGTMHGGIVFELSFFDNGDGEVFTNQKIRLSANCNEAVICLHDENQLTPAKLRDLAHWIEQEAERNL